MPARVTVPSIQESTAIKHLASCIIQICDWMASNYLKLNEEKLQVIWLGMRQQLAKITITVTLLHMSSQLSG